LPEDKVRAVEETVREFGSAAMVGDGVNDAPAMAASSLGIAMGASLAVISNALRLLRGYGTPE